MVVHQVHVHRLATLEPEHHAPVARHANAPQAGQVALQRMQPGVRARDGIAGALRSVQRGQDAPKPVRERGGHLVRPVPLRQHVGGHGRAPVALRLRGRALPPGLHLLRHRPGLGLGAGGRLRLPGIAAGPGHGGVVGRHAPRGREAHQPAVADADVHPAAVLAGWPTPRLTTQPPGRRDSQAALRPASAIP